MTVENGCTQVLPIADLAVRLLQEKVVAVPKAAQRAVKMAAQRAVQMAASMLQKAAVHG